MVRGRVETPRQAVSRFFDSLGWKPFGFQRRVWRAFEDGSSGLVHSATGTGKTLAVWLGPVLEWIRENPDRERWNAKRLTIAFKELLNQLVRYRRDIHAIHCLTTYPQSKMGELDSR